MGTWGAPSTKLEKKLLKDRLKLLKEAQDAVSELFGDDIVLDNFDTANDRIEWALKGKWPIVDHRTVDCKHSGFTVDAPNVCKLCRLNIKD